MIVLPKNETACPIHRRRKSRETRSGVVSTNRRMTFDAMRGRARLDPIRVRSRSGTHGRGRVVLVPGARGGRAGRHRVPARPAPRPVSVARTRPSTGRTSSTPATKPGSKPTANGKATKTDVPRQEPRGQYEMSQCAIRTCARRPKICPVRALRAGRALLRFRFGGEAADRSAWVLTPWRFAS